MHIETGQEEEMEGVGKKRNEEGEGVEGGEEEDGGERRGKAGLGR